MKQKQKKDKTISQILIEVTEEMCSKYCRYPLTWDQRDGELCDSDICANCPLNRL